MSQTMVSTKNMTSFNDMVSTETNDVVIQYQYKISFYDMPNISYANTIIPQLMDLFKTNLTFCDAIKQFVIESNQDVSKRDIEKMIQNTDIKLNKFYKAQINKF
jgi:hypothetical protein